MDRLNNYGDSVASTSNGIMSDENMLILLQRTLFEEDEMIPGWGGNYKENKEGEREISLSEVAKHDSVEDCWVVLYDVVYDMTPFLSMHPGGMEILLESAGRDATLAYQEVGHNKQGLELLSHLRLGVLPESERLPTFW